MNPKAKPPTSKLPSHFNVAVDVVALTIKRGLLQVAVVQRHGDISCIVDKRTGISSEVTRQDIDFALPGGRVEETDQTLSHAAQRELHEETSITIDPKDLIQIGAYGDRGRDPRPGRTISVAFVALSPEFGLPFAGSDAERAQFVDVVEILSPPNRLEFDHGQIIRDAITTVRDLMERTPVALKLCGKEFTMSELRHVYEIIFHHAYNPDANFERYAERIRREDEKFGSKVFDDQIKSLSRAVGFSSRGKTHCLCHSAMLECVYLAAAKQLVTWTYCQKCRTCWPKSIDEILKHWAAENNQRVRNCDFILIPPTSHARPNSSLASSKRFQTKRRLLPRERANRRRCIAEARPSVWIHR